MIMYQLCRLAVAWQPADKHDFTTLTLMKKIDYWTNFFIWTHLLKLPLSTAVLCLASHLANIIKSTHRWTVQVTVSRNCTFFINAKSWTTETVLLSTSFWGNASFQNANSVVHFVLCEQCCKSLLTGSTLLDTWNTKKVRRVYARTFFH